MGTKNGTGTLEPYPSEVDSLVASGRRFLNEPMGLSEWFSRNWADTAAGTHRDLQPMVIPLAPAVALVEIRQRIERLPRWRVETVSDVGLQATHRTRLWGFVDDVRVTVEPGVSGSIVNARSQSRVGKGDLGQNRRNLKELWAALDALRRV